MTYPFRERGIYRHYKNFDLVCLFATSFREVDQAPLVTYFEYKSHKAWTREAEVFDQAVSDPERGIVSTPRFEWVRRASPAELLSASLGGADVSELSLDAEPESDGPPPDKDGSVRDPSNYRRMSVPHEDREAATKALEGFYRETFATRKKYRIRDVHLIMATGVMHEGEEVEMHLNTHIGSSERALPMLAAAFGHEEAAHEAMIAKLRAGGGAKRR